MNSENTAVLSILSADKVFVTLADGTENVLSNGGKFESIDENNIDGTVFSRQDLTFNGSGTLTVTLPAGHGIVCKDDLVFTEGTYMVTSASHGLDANDSVRIAEASITIHAGKDGIHAENTEDVSLGFVYILNHLDFITIPISINYRLHVNKTIIFIEIIVACYFSISFLNFYFIFFWIENIISIFFQNNISV